MKNALAIGGIVIKELYRRKDFYVLFILTALITLGLGAMNFFNDARIVRYLKEICLLLIWVSTLVIAVVTAARQIPFEKETCTIFPLLAKPVTRWELVLGKFLGCWFAAGIALVVFYLFFAIITGTREHYWPVLNILQAVWMHWMMLGVVSALTIFGSVVFTAPSSNVTIVLLISVGILLIGRNLRMFALEMVEPARTILCVAYYSLPHLEFFDMRDLVIHDWGLAPWWAVGMATLYAAAYSIFLIVCAWLVFRRQVLS
ncbi:MAG: ABC transporter permease [Verrucomicrobia bacterium]|nr:ABC transporter permease [Verrucomicrobiota bacterium]MCF7707459.1 ABC transporter permease [Verrucomicrobiota bacterium]